MVVRRLDNNVLVALQRSPAVTLLGPRQVGKSTLALHIAEAVPAVYLDLENLTDLEKVKDVSLFHDANREKLIFINNK